MKVSINLVGLFLKWITLDWNEQEDVDMLLQWNSHSPVTFPSVMARSGSLGSPYTTSSIQPVPPANQKRSRVDEWALKQAKPIALPVATDILTRMATQIVRTNGIQKPFKIHVVKKPKYNAGALSNGTIMFHLDMLKRAKSPEELAFVLAHEISHLEYEDCSRRKKRYEVAMVATAFGAGLAHLCLQKVGIFKNFKFLRTILISTVPSILPLQWFAAGGRTDEARADLNAIRLLRNTGFSPIGYRTAIANMNIEKNNASWLAKANWKIFGEDHPALPTRKASLDQLIQTQRPYYPLPVMSAIEWNYLKQAALNYRSVNKPRDVLQGKVC